MKLFFGKIEQNKAILQEDEAHHFVKVLRGKEHDIIHVTDGNGIMAMVEITSASKKSVEGNVIEFKTDTEESL